MVFRVDLVFFTYSGVIEFLISWVMLGFSIEEEFGERVGRDVGFFLLLGFLSRF